MTFDDHYIVKCMSARMPAPKIAAKLGISVQELEKRWAAIQKEVDANLSNGYYALSEQFNVFCSQYQLLGESMKLLAHALGGAMSDQDLKNLITVDPEITFQNLRKLAIVLNPYQFTDPSKALEEELKRLQKGN